MPNRGKVFSAFVQLVGGMARGDRSIEVEIAQWDDCRQCTEFNSRYHLCLAKVALEAAVATQ